MRESEKIHIPLDDWQKNSGIVGFINIVGRENVEFKNSELIFDSQLLADFSEKYFDYLINTYQKTLSWHKIVSFQSTIDQYRQTDYELFSEKDLNNLNKYIKDIAKYYLKSASYQASYPLIGSDFDIKAAGAKLQTVGTLTKKETFMSKREEILTEVKMVVSDIQQIIDYCNSSDGRKYLAAKNVIYTIVKNGWDGVSILNPQTKEKDVYVDFQNFFVEPVLVNLDSDKSKYKFTCCSCNQPIKDFSNTLTFLIKTGFDTNKKNSHAWNFSNDLGVCPMCKLIYACLPAGMTYVYNQGIFINANSNAEELVRVNQKLTYEVLRLNKAGITSTNTYQALIQAFNQKLGTTSALELEDVHVVRYQNDTYRFNLLSKGILSIIKKSDKELERLKKAGYTEAKEAHYLYQEVVERLLNSQNMFTLIHKLVVLKATNKANLYYGLSHVDNLIHINQEFLEGINVMTKLTQDELKKIKGTAFYFKKGYGNPNKASSISYKLLNALKINDRDGFMNVILNSYAYLGQEVPTFFLRVFEQDETFKTIGYAFVSGIIGPIETTEGGTNDEK